MKLNNVSCNCENGLIDITGLCEPENVTQVINQYPYWKQMYIPETLEIPDEKPDVEVINSLDIAVSIIRTKVIKTPRTYTGTNLCSSSTSCSCTECAPMPNLEGKLLSGRKLIIEGQLCQKITYTADMSDQPVHSAHFYVPFSSYIVVPKTILFTNQDGTTTCLDSCDVDFEVNTCIEDATITAIDSRHVLKRVTLLLYAVPTQSC